VVGTSLAFAQKKVTGTVVSSEDNSPVVGASVVVKGTTQGGITDVDGKFTINVPAYGRMLQISYIGMKTMTVAAKATMKIAMDPDVTQIGEVVVTGMQKMDKRMFTGATTKIDAANAKLDGLADISRSLEGRVAGVSVQNVSGTFGTAPKIRVRGATSIYGNSKPLWVVDGVVMEDVTEVSADQLSSGDAVTLISSAIAGLNSDDIESFQILKDGSATSIYGARAMAGVIVVTTKKGKAGTSRISYTGEYTSRLVPNYRDYNIMNSQEQMGIYKEMSDKGWLNFSDVYRASNSGVYGKMYKLINTYDTKTGTFALENTPEAKNAYLREAEMRNTDWFDHLFSSAVSANHSVSISSGTEKSQFYASLSAMTDPGWYKASSINRYTANLNTTYNILKNLSVNLISSASYRKQKAPGTLSQDIDVVRGEVKRDFDINPYSYALNTSRAMDANEIYTRNYADFNIDNELENNYLELSVTDMKFQGELRWKPIPDLELSVLGSYRYSGTSQEHFIKDNSNQAMAYRAMDDSTIRNANSYLYSDPDNPYALPISVLPEGGIYQRTDYRMNGYDFRATASWNHLFAQKHFVNLFGGMETNYTNRAQSFFNGWGMQYSMGEIPYFVYQFFKKAQENGTDYYSLGHSRVRSAAFFANATYSFDGKYVLNGTIRYEGTNKLGKSRSARWLPTWNVSAAWNMHEEEFFKSLEPAFSHLTLKASYSLTGDRGPSNVSNSRMIVKSTTPWRPFSNITETGLYVDSNENSDLTYEKKHELNIGADMGFLKNRINFTVDWYKRNNYDLIGITNTMGMGGEIQKYANVATMKSHGLEMSLSTKNIVTKDFTWTTDFIFSKAITKVTDLKSTARLVDLVTGSGFAREGYPVRALFSIPFAGLTEDGFPQFKTNDGGITVTGTNFQEREDLGYLKYEGPTDPKYTGSLGNIFSYKGFRLNIFMTYSFGNVVRLSPVFHSSYSDLTATPRDFKNRWTIPGDEAYTDVPVIASRREVHENSSLSIAYNSYNYSTARIAKGDFIRMKEMSLSYDFPKSWISKLKMSNLSLKLQATNLFLLYADKKLNGQDPEFFNSGGVAAPVPKQFTLTLRVGM
jgi:TonB-linked SusC/RagA family outer membrane protein